MKLHSHSNKLETNAKSVSNKFGIGNAAKIIGILRDKLYSNKIQTLTQEYVSNARDAMREAGKDEWAFEITVPTRLNPTLKIRDFGLGMTPERVENTFIMYGTSTKEHTNDFTGGLGIGAKSAFSYTDSFTVVTFVDGIRRAYVAHIGLSNEGSLDLISEDATDEANGTEIQIAVKPGDIDDFRSAVFRAIYFWEQKPTLKGELSPPELIKGHVVSDLVEVVDHNMLPEYVRGNYYNEEAIAVIDGIVYPIGSQLFEKVKKLGQIKVLIKKKLVLHFGNGVVEVAASREAISDSPHTIAALEKLAKRALVEIQTHISNAFGNIPDTSTYLNTYKEMSKAFCVDRFAKFGEYRIESGTIKSDLLTKVKMTSIHTLDSRGRYRVDRVTRDERMESQRNIDIEYFDSVFFTTNSESKVAQNKRIREFLKGKNKMILIELLDTHVSQKDGKGGVLVDKEGKAIMVPVSYPKELAQVINDFNACDVMSIDYVELPKEAKAKVTREHESLCLHTFGSQRHTYTTLAKNAKKWFYVPMKDGAFTEEFCTTNLKELDRYTQEVEGTNICGLAERSIKMVEGDSNFSPLSDWLKDFKPSEETRYTVMDYYADKHAEDMSTIMEIKKLDDAFLVDMIKLHKAIAKAKKLGHVPEILKKKSLEDKEIKEFVEATDKLDMLLKVKYPLVRSLRYCEDKQELGIYMNAKYNMKRGK